MKNIQSLLSHLSRQPQFRYLGQHSCYRKFIQLLPPKFQEAIAFVYIENKTLFIALSHPGYKMELNYNRDLLKSVLTMLREHDTSCSQLEAEKVAIFNSKYFAPTTKENHSSDPKYFELSSADFLIQTDDKILHEKFESIKNHIISNRTLE